MLSTKFAAYHVVVANVPLIVNYFSVTLPAGDGAVQPDWAPQPPCLQKIPANEVVCVI